MVVELKCAHGVQSDRSAGRCMTIVHTQLFAAVPNRCLYCKYGPFQASKLTEK